MNAPLRSDALVFFGATGDLAYKMIFPALQAMIHHGHLDVPVVGVAKAGWNLDQLRARARESLEKHGGVDEGAFGKLSELLRYVDGDYNDRKTFDALRDQLGGTNHPIHYLAIPPTLFSVVVDHLGNSGCAQGARVIVEKPFGRDLASAQALNATLMAVFKEPDVFRIDHYLGKETVQNLVVLRFGNTFLEPIWNRSYVKSVQIVMAEAFGIRGRGALYDELGTIRDVVQNHLLQVVGLLAMEPPATAGHDSIRDQLVNVFRQIRPLAPQDVVRGQFEGFLREPGVAPTSHTETFAALSLKIDSWRWGGVPFLIRTGKCLPVTTTEVLVELTQPPLPTYAPGPGNHLRMRLSPELNIALGAQTKRPGEAMIGEPTELVLVAPPKADEMTAYERLLGDAMNGDPTLFSRMDAIEAAWAIVDPVLGAEAPEAQPYKPGSWGPAAADQLAVGVGGWLRPTASG
jgi:glucose-6-phosphate 1-dehydrogenase